jgi:hypothetical protein
LIGSAIFTGRIVQYGEPGEYSTGFEIFRMTIYYAEVIFVLGSGAWHLLTVLLLGLKRISFRSLEFKLGAAAFLFTEAVVCRY